MPPNANIGNIAPQTETNQGCDDKGNVPSLLKKMDKFIEKHVIPGRNTVYAERSKGGEVPKWHAKDAHSVTSRGKPAKLHYHTQPGEKWKKDVTAGKRTRKGEPGEIISFMDEGKLFNGKIPQNAIDIEVFLAKHSKTKATWRDPDTGRKNRIIAPSAEKKGVDQNKKRVEKNVLPVIIKIMKKIEKDFNSANPSDDVIAAYIIAKTGFRIGTKRDLKKVKAFGTTTLQVQHTKIKGDNIQFNFRSKKGKITNLTIKNAKLAQVLSKKIKGKKEGMPILQTHRKKVAQYLSKISNDKVKPKDLRTMFATYAYTESIKQNKPPKTVQEAKFLHKKAVQAAADAINDTFNVCFRHYILPHAFVLLEEQFPGFMGNVKFLKEKEKFNFVNPKVREEDGSINWEKVTRELRDFLGSIHIAEKSKKENPKIEKDLILKLDNFLKENV